MLIKPHASQVAIYDDRLEVTSPGRISPDLTIEQLIKGNSRVRNVAIGAAFQYMHIIEKWGTGIPRIYQEAKEYGLQEPELKDFGTSFRISIYRKAAETDVFGVVGPATDATNTATNSASGATNAATNIGFENAAGKRKKFSENEIALLRYAKEHPFATQKEVAGATAISIGTVKRLFPLLQKKVALRRNGNHRDGSWEVLIQIPEKTMQRSGT